MDKFPDQLPNLSSFSHEQKDELIRLLFPLTAEVRRLSARVAELEARLSKNSHNSSKPPSSVWGLYLNRRIPRLKITEFAGNHHFCAIRLEYLGAVFIVWGIVGVL